MIPERGFVFELGDPSVGLFGDQWLHEDCPGYRPSESATWDEPEGVIETALAEVRSTPMTVRRWWLLTCGDCAQQRIVTDTDFDPDDEALIEADAEAGRWEAEAEAMLAADDDDPSPYAGTYSEE